jgi:hypothetical protein
MSRAAIFSLGSHTTNAETSEAEGKLCVPLFHFPINFSV